MGHKPSKLAQLIDILKEPSLSNDQPKRIIRLISKKTVNELINGVPLILFYLKKTASQRVLCPKVLEAFADNGCDLNVQDDEGRSPLHLIVGHDYTENTLTRRLKLIKLFLATGVDPFLVDVDGNTVLMVAILTQQSASVVKLIVGNDLEVARSLFKQRNNAGFDALTLYFKSVYHHDSVTFGDLIKLGPDMQSIDDDGNSYLHNLFLMPVERYTPTIQYPVPSATPAFCPIDVKSVVSELIKLGVDISLKNSDSLIPLQVALLCTTADKLTASSEVLKQLVPSTDVLNELEPWPGSDQLRDLLSVISLQTPVPV